MPASRIMIVGGPGSGKTWLAGVLGRRLNLPIYSVDDVVWDAQGSLRPDSEIDASMLAMAAQDRWIIEGGNTRTYAERATRADAIIRLAPPLRRRLHRVLLRDGLKPALLRWTLRYDAVFGVKDRALAGERALFFEIRSRRQMAAFLSEEINLF